jgi:arylsulfatase A-like enzyme
MNHALTLLTALLLAPLPALRAANAPLPSKPNMIVIYTDDRGYADLGCMGIMADVKTPNTDSLAAGGVRMTAGYVTAPQCSPSRCGLISGQSQGKVLAWITMACSSPILGCSNCFER